MFRVGEKVKLKSGNKFKDGNTTLVIARVSGKKVYLLSTNATYGRIVVNDNLLVRASDKKQTPVATKAKPQKQIANSVDLSKKNHPPVPKSKPFIRPMPYMNRLDEANKLFPRRVLPKKSPVKIVTLKGGILRTLKPMHSDIFDTINDDSDVNGSRAGVFLIQSEKNDFMKGMVVRNAEVLGPVEFRLVEKDTKQVGGYEGEDFVIFTSAPIRVTYDPSLKHMMDIKDTDTPYEIMDDFLDMNGI